MDSRREELTQLKSYIETVDKEVTMILQSLQWDRNQLLEGTAKVYCKYDPTHRVPPDKKEAHEKDCYLKKQGYSTEDILLPDPVDPKANTIVKLSTEDIIQIINYASQTDPLFKKGCEGSEPLTLGRLQAAYTPDERRAIYDAVVSAVPACHDLADLALSSSYGDGEKVEKTKSRAEILSELRDMRRRRTRYRVAAKTTKYSDVLRDVIKTQMELYSEVQQETKPQFSDSGKIPKVEPGESSSSYINHDTKRHKREHSENSNREIRSNKSRNYSHDNKKYHKDDQKSRYDNKFETIRDKYNSQTYNKKDYRSYKDRNKEDENDKIYDDNKYHRENRGENSRSKSKYPNEFETKRDKYKTPNHNDEGYRFYRDRYKEEKNRDSRSNERRRYNYEYEKDGR